MGPFDPDLIIVFPSIIVFTLLILRYKLKKKELEVNGGDGELGSAVDALRDELADMQEHTQAQLSEIQERLDFAERLLAAGRASQEDRSG